MPLDLTVLLDAHTQIHEAIYARPWDRTALTECAKMLDIAVPEHSVLSDSNPLSGILESVRFTLHPPNKKRKEFHRSRVEMVRREIRRLSEIAGHSADKSREEEAKGLHDDLYKAKRFIIVLIAEYKLFNQKPGDDL